MQSLNYYWINVFTTEQDKGNPLPVFVLKKTLSQTAMQKIATMMNQSETVFIENLNNDSPKLHIYTPMQELPFAGHPIIGALQIIKKLKNSSCTDSLETLAGTVNVQIDQHQQIYWIKAPITPKQRASTLDIPLTSQMLNIPESQIVSAPQWLNTGSEQLIVELSDANAVDSIQINLDLFQKHATLYAGRTMIYLWARDHDNVYTRYLYFKNGALGEDSGTGSACSNLGGLQVLEGNNNFEWTIRQGCLLGRENVLFLKVTANQEIWIGGQNRFMGKGELLWAD
ncbi:PhzF family phenazine biosynthesis protein [Wohlfahrtiimonas larvae]|uniref:PhzF family phenazine biosynthesis protein n=1 Tax=Wohlfahrtiimonas larvae TaxID=1157986 RepID=A0ABP9N3F4_9GAMM|nr:PhzF family phenazine biosynthesis protein [Wohlfahrtiimonas larvae]